MQTLILAGGLGTRLQQINKGKPKILADINGLPFIYYLFEWLYKNGCSQIILCICFLSDQIKNIVGNSYKNINIIYSEEPFLLGTGGAIHYAIEKITENEFLVINGDTYCNINLNSIYHFHNKNKSEGTIVIKCTEDNNTNVSQIYIDKNEQIIKYTEKSKIIDNASYQSTGVYILNKNLFNCIIKETNLSIEYDLFPQWVEQHKLFGYITKERFIDIGTPEGYREFLKYDNNQNAI